MLSQYLKKVLCFRMPRRYQRKAPERCLMTDEQLESARKLIKKGISKRKIALQLGLNESTLMKRLKLGKVAVTLGRYVPTFTKVQEEEIYQYARKTAEFYHGLTMMSLRKMIYEYAKVNKIPNRFNKTLKLAGRDWVYGFLRRYPNLKLQQTDDTFATAAAKPESNIQQEPRASTSSAEPLTDASSLLFECSDSSQDSYLSDIIPCTPSDPLCVEPLITTEPQSTSPSLTVKDHVSNTSISKPFTTASLCLPSTSEGPEAKALCSLKSLPKVTIPNRRKRGKLLLSSDSHKSEIVNKKKARKLAIKILKITLKEKLKTKISTKRTKGSDKKSYRSKKVENTENIFCCPLCGERSVNPPTEDGIKCSVCDSWWHGKNPFNIISFYFCVGFLSGNY